MSPAETADPIVRAQEGARAFGEELAREGFTARGPLQTGLAPGRVNLLGEHADYSEGYVMPAAINRHVAAAFSPGSAPGRSAALLHFQSLDFTDSFALDLARLADLRADPGLFARVTGGPGTRWRRYAAGIVLELDAIGDPPPPGLVTIAGNVPLGAGLSSSAALEAALYTALATDPAPVPEAALLCQRAENRWAGVPCGIMDQFASFMGQAGRLLFLDCRTLEYRRLELPAGSTLTVIESGVRRELADGAYRERRHQIETAVELLRRFIGPVTTLRDVPPEDFPEFEDLLPEPLRSRVEHVLGAIARVREGVRALTLGQGRAFGELMTACHHSLAGLYEVSTPELDLITESALQVAGVLGARLTGAGFGGCCVVLHEQEARDELVAAVRSAWGERFGSEPVFHHLSAADGARRLEGEPA